MTRSKMLLTAGLFARALHGPTATAQTPVAPGVAPGCTYATCALRLEPGFFGRRLVRGASGESVSRLGAFGGGIQPLLNGPDSAAAYGQRYVRASHRSAALSLIGAVAYTVVLVRTDNLRNRFSSADVVVGFTGAGFLIASAPFARQAQRSLSQAVWWYNAALPR